MDEVIKLLEQSGIPFAYDHFAEGEGPDPPFLCYRVPDSANFAADGQVYYRIGVIDMELYTDRKDVALERKLERLLSASGIFWNKEEYWIESEKLYEVVYEFQKGITYAEQEEQVEIQP